MSKVFSFRLSEYNPREAQALSILHKHCDEGHSKRHIITEALIQFGRKTPESKHIKNGELLRILDQVKLLLNQNSGNDGLLPRTEQTKQNLSESFLASMKVSVKPGYKFRR